MADRGARRRTCPKPHLGYHDSSIATTAGFVNAFNEGDLKGAKQLAESSIRRTEDPLVANTLRAAKAALAIDCAGRAEDVWEPLTAAHEIIRTGAISSDVAEMIDWACDGLFDSKTWSETVGIIWVKATAALWNSELFDEDIAAQHLARCIASCVMHRDMATAAKVLAIALKKPPALDHPQDSKDLRLWLVWARHFCFLWHDDIMSGKVAVKTLQTILNVEGSDSLSKTLSSARFVRRVLTKGDDPHMVSHDQTDDIHGPFPSDHPHYVETALELLGSRDHWVSTQARLEVFRSLDPSMITAHWSLLQDVVDTYVSSRLLMPQKKLSELETFRKTLEGLSVDSSLPQLDRRNVALALLRLQMGDGSPQVDKSTSLTRYVDIFGNQRWCFNDIKPYFERLDYGSRRRFLHRLGNTGSTSNATRKIDAVSTKDLDTTLAVVEELGAQMLATKAHLVHWTIPKDLGDTGTPLPEITMAQRVYEMSKAVSDCQKSCPGLLKDAHGWIVADTVVIAAQYLLRNHTSASAPIASQQPRAGTVNLIQAMALMEEQLAHQTFDQTAVLLLVRTHLLLGNVDRSSKLWKELAVKRATLDSLGPLFHDRVSTITPTIDGLDVCLADFASNPHPSVQYRTCLPVFTALSRGNLDSAANCLDHLVNSRRSFSRVMAVVENNRMVRCGISRKSVHVPTSSLNITPTTPLHTDIDTGSFPSWESSEAVPIDLLLSLGPRPTSQRGHLALQCERYFEAVQRKQGERDREAFLETMEQITASMSQHLDGSELVTTPHEWCLYSIIHLLSTVILMAVKPATGATSNDMKQLVNELSNSIEHMFGPRTAHDDHPMQAEELLDILRELPQVALARDAVAAANAAATVIQSYASESTVSNSKVLGYIQRLRKENFSRRIKLAQERLLKAKTFMNENDAVEQIARYIADQSQPQDQMWLRPQSVKSALDLCKVGWQLALSSWTRIKWE